MPRPPRQPGRSHGGLVSWPLYRLLLVVCILPSLAAFLFVREPALPDQPTQELTFDGSAAAEQTASLLSIKGSFAPGGDGNLAAAQHVRTALSKDGYVTAEDPFAVRLPGRGAVSLENVTGFQRGRLPETVAVIAHRDGIGSAADDNDSGTGLMLEIAHQLAGTARERGLLFVSTDAGTTGGQGAVRFADTWSPHFPIVAAIVLDSVSAPAGSQIRLLVRPDAPRGTSATVYQALRRAVLRYAGHPAQTPGTLDQLTGYAVPYATNEQGPLITHRVPAVTLTAGPKPDPDATFESLSTSQLGQVGTVVVNLLAQLDGASGIERTGPPAVFLGDAVTRGHLLQLAIVLLLVPFITCALDAAARCRRRRIPLADGLRAFAWRASTWLAALVTLWLLALLPGGTVSGIDAPPLPGATGLTRGGALVTAAVCFGWWFVMVRPRVRRRGPVSGQERTGGLVSAWLALAFAGLLLCAINPFAVIIVLPAAHASLWLPRIAPHGRAAMLALLAVSAIGPLLIVWELWVGQGLGSSAPAALIAMAGSGYLSPAITIPLALAAGAATQMAAVVLGVYGGAKRGKRLYA